MSVNNTENNSAALLDAFRTHYHRFNTAIHSACGGQTDSVVLARLGDDIDQYLNLVNEVCQNITHLKASEL